MSDKMASSKGILQDLRNVIVKLRNEKKSYGEIAKIVGKSRSSVQTVIHNFNINGNVFSKKRTGRPRKLNERDARYIRRRVHANPRLIQIHPKTLQMQMEQQQERLFILKQ